jgi:arginase
MLAMTAGQPDVIPLARAADLIGAACGRGARDGRCRSGPDALRADGLNRWLRARGLDARWCAELSADSVESAPSDLHAVATTCRWLASETAESVRRDIVFAVIGGDHSCAVGTWSGVHNVLRTRGPLGLVWIDAHMDCHVPETSPSGALHGMPLACLLGHGPLPLTGLARPGPALGPSHVSLIGVRSFEPAEAELVRALGVRVFFMGEVRARGLTSVFDEALAIAHTGTVGFGVTVDLDALDPEDAPGVGTPVPEGLRGDDLLGVLRSLGRLPDFVGVEVAELNPALDHGGVTCRLARDLIAAALAAEDVDEPGR